jgi:hypothetical protein
MNLLTFRDDGEPMLIYGGKVYLQPAFAMDDRFFDTLTIDSIQGYRVNGHADVWVNHKYVHCHVVFLGAAFKSHLMNPQPV